MASLRSSIVHSRSGCSLAKFLLVSIGNFPNAIGTSRALYESLDFPSADKPGMWFPTES